MRTIFLFLLFPFVAFAETKFVFDGDWKGERIELPPPFAPTLGWTGVENIRFSPGMFDQAEESFFSYALVFLLEEGADVSAEGIQREVLTYYKGLSAAVLKGKNMNTDTEKFEFDLEEPVEAEGVTTYKAKLKWIEPFATQKGQFLSMEIRVWKHGNQPALFFSVSPQAEDHEVWKDLFRIRDAFRFED
ncbi:MAG: hypothetical protein ACI8UO_005441 [Verrucomicrobiales bacterium]|jgi:hypothetical protein